MMLCNINALVLDPCVRIDNLETFETLRLRYFQLVLHLILKDLGIFLNNNTFGVAKLSLK